MASPSEMSGNIVKGAYSNITQYPHSAFLSIIIYACGASIVNQVILLTAAHCVYENPEPENIIAFVGKKKRQIGFQYTVLSLVIHEKYDPVRIWNDVALLRLKRELEFGKRIAKVLLLPDPPIDETACIAGWGVTDEVGGPISDYLKYISLKVYKRKDCMKIGVNRLHEGAICGEHKKKQGHPGQGDSGSALVVRNYIQIGIVSYNRPDVSKTNTIFTDTGYFYNWIQENARKLYCNDKINKMIKNLI